MGNTTACTCGRDDSQLVGEDGEEVHDEEVKPKPKKKKKKVAIQEAEGEEGAAPAEAAIDDDASRAGYDDTASHASAASTVSAYSTNGKSSKSGKSKKSSKTKKSAAPTPTPAPTNGNGTNDTVAALITDEKSLRPGGTTVDVTPLLPAFKLLNEGQQFTRYLLPPNTTATQLPDGTYVWPEDQFREEEIYLWWEPDSKLGTLFWCSPPPTVGNRPHKQPYQQMRVHHISDIVSKLGILPGGIEPVAAFPRRVQVEACISMIDRSKAQLRLMAAPRDNLRANDVRMNWFKALRAVRGSGGQAARVTQSPALSHKSLPTASPAVTATGNGAVAPPTPAAVSYTINATPQLSNSSLAAAAANGNSGNTSSAPSSVGPAPVAATSSPIGATPHTVQRSLVQAATVDVSPHHGNPPETPPIQPAATAAAVEQPKKKAKSKGKKK